MQFRPNDDKKESTPRPQLPPWRNWVFPILLMLLLGWMLLRVPDMVSSVASGPTVEVPYSFFIDQVKAGNVSQVLLQDTQAHGVLKAPVRPPGGDESSQEFRNFVTTLLPVEDPELPQLLRDNDVTVVAQ